MHLVEGDVVNAGQVLAEIDPRPYQVQLEPAEAALAHDQALLGNAKVDVERYTKLLSNDAIPKSSWTHKPRWSRSTPSRNMLARTTPPR